MRVRLILITAAILIFVVGGLVLRILLRGGALKTIEPHFAGTCGFVKGPVGPEDITIHPRTGVAYVSACDRRALLAGEPVPGALFAYDLNAADPKPVNLTPDADLSFQPHGLSLWVDPRGNDALYVVNHPPGEDGGVRHTIEVFDLTRGALVHRESLRSELLVMPNDLVAVGRDRFYVTNTHGSPPGILQDIETYLQLPRASIVFYGDGEFRRVRTSLLYPNGINRSADGRTLYVASVTGFSVLVFDRDPRTDDIALREEVPIGTGGDNIEIDPSGNLWIGSHPKLLDVAAHMRDSSARAPAQVMRVAPRAARRGAAGTGAATDWDVNEIYLNAGDQISAVSVAARRGHRLLLGQIFGEGFLDCTMD